MAEIFGTADKVTREKTVIVGPPQPTRVTIYEKESGKAVEMFGVDAREALAQEDSPYQSMPKGQEKVKAAAPDHSVKEVLGVSSTATIIESPLRAEAAAKAPAKAEKADKK